MKYRYNSATWRTLTPKSYTWLHFSMLQCNRHKPSKIKGFRTSIFKFSQKCLKCLIFQYFCSQNSLFIRVSEKQIKDNFYRCFMPTLYCLLHLHISICIHLPFFLYICNKQILKIDRYLFLYLPYL